MNDIYILAQKVCEFCGINYKAFLGRTRIREVSECRHIFFYYAVRVSGITERRAGAICGGRNNSSVHHGIMNVIHIKELNKKYKEFEKWLESQ